MSPRIILARTNFWRRLVYTIYSPVYDRVVRGFIKKRRRSIALADLKAGERVLLVGAGTGVDLEFMAVGPELTAIDLTPAMLAILRRRAQRLGIKVDARVMDAHNMEFPDSSFDVAILHLILSVIPDPSRCIREVARVLQPGGRIVVLDKLIPDTTDPHWILRLINPLLSLLGTEITRKLGPIIDGVGLTVVHEEAAGSGGLFRIVLLEKAGRDGDTRDCRLSTSAR